MKPLLFKQQPTLIIAILFFSSIITWAQQPEAPYPTSTDTPDWVYLMYDENPNVDFVKQAYETYYKTNKFVRNSHTQYYKRWLRSLSREINGRNHSQVSKRYISDNEADYIERCKANQTNARSSTEWESIGPIDFDKEAASRSYAPGAAHVYTVEQASSNPDILYAGTATAGLWKTTDKGANWTLVTRDMLINQILSLEIDHSNENIVYFVGSGNLYKTTDGAATWNEIGNTDFANLNHDCKDIVMYPDNSNNLLLSSSQGLFRTTDGGNNWTQIMSGTGQEIEFHPVNNSIIYWIKQVDNHTEFYKSIDGGLSFTQQTNGWPDPAADEEQKRTEIATTPAAPNKVYALATGEANGGSGLYGIYISEDAGETWTFTCCGPQPAGPPVVNDPPDPDNPNNMNLMGWSDIGDDDGGQYYYDLALDVSDTDPDHVFVAGVNLWISTDGGTTFTCPAKWSHGGKPNYVHADIHDVRFFGSDLWVACDGGIFYSNNIGETFDRTMYGIEGTDFWGFGVGFSNSEVMIGGTYHNGTLLKDGDTYTNGWISTLGGDNYRGFVNFANDRIAYHDGGRVVLSGNRTVNLSVGGFNKQPNATYIIGESSEMVFDPRCNNIVYTGNENSLWRSKDNGATSDLVYEFDNKVTAISIAWSNPNVMYVATWGSYWGDNKQVWKTTDAGVTWSEITPPSPNTWIAYDVAVSDYDENTIWVAHTMQATSNASDGHKIWKTTDGGSTWNNITTATLDGEFITNMAFQRGTDGGIYLGTRRAVYYRNNTMSDWVLYNSNLPISTHSVRLVPNYGIGKLRNGTNRSVYQVDFYEPSMPSAQIAAEQFTANCLEPNIQFYDHSAVHWESATWNWYFEGGTPETSTERNPLVSYDSPGSYSVVLTVTDAYGTHTQAYDDFILFNNNTEEVPYTQDFNSEEITPTAWTFDSSNDSFNWQETNLAEDGSCLAGNALWVNHFSINNPNEEAYLITNPFDLSNTTDISLSYDYAYVRYANGYEDGFRVEISTDCGQSWTILLDQFGTELATAPDNSDNWSPTCDDWANNTINLNEYANQEIQLRFVGVNGWGNNFYLDNIQVNATVVPPSIVQVQLMLEGTYNPLSNEMSTALIDSGLLPNAQSYQAAPWNYMGNEQAISLSSNVVDWILVELRNANDITTTMGSAAALLYKNGNLHSADGGEGVKFYGIDDTQNYYIVIRHKNHIDIVSSIPLAVNNAAAYDFTNTDNVLQGSSQLVAVADGMHAMLAGDADGNGVCNVADYNIYLSQLAGLNTYQTADLNLDGNVSIDDFNLFASNASAIGIASIRLYD